MVVNMKLGKDGKVENNKSKIALTWLNSDNGNSKEVVLKNLEASETRCALLANLMVSSGLQGKVNIQKL